MDTRGMMEALESMSLHGQGTIKNPHEQLMQNLRELQQQIHEILLIGQMNSKTSLCDNASKMETEAGETNAYQSLNGYLLYLEQMLQLNNGYYCYNNSSLFDEMKKHVIIQNNTSLLEIVNKIIDVLKTHFRCNENNNFGLTQEYNLATQEALLESWLAHHQQKQQQKQQQAHQQQLQQQMHAQEDAALAFSLGGVSLAERSSWGQISQQPAPTQNNVWFQQRR